MLCGRLIIAEDKISGKGAKNNIVASNFTTGNPLKFKNEHLNEYYFDTLSDYVTMISPTSLADFLPPTSRRLEVLRTKLKLKVWHGVPALVCANENGHEPHNLEWSHFQQVIQSKNHKCQCSVLI